MRKLKIFILSILLLMILPIKVFAVGSIAPSTRNITVTRGGSTTFTISASNAVGRVDIGSANPSVASVNVSSKWLDNDSIAVTVSGNSVGSTNITVNLYDAATYDKEELTGSYTIAVNVVEPSHSNNGGGSFPSNNNIGNNNNHNNNVNSNLSTNNKLSSLTVDGHELKKVDDNNYELTVSNNVTNINVNGKTEDDKATVTGTGVKELAVGENIIEVVVTSESGVQNIIKIKVIRKDGYYLEDLKTVLNNSSITKADIKINSDSIISKEDLENIKKSEKTVNFNVYDDSNKLLYSWIVNGKEIRDTDEFNTNVKFISDYTKKIRKISNYADGLYINFGHNKKLPNGVKIKLLVGDKYTDGDKVNLYFYNKDKMNLKLIEKELTVKDGYIEFDAKDYSNCFITMSSIYPKDSNVVSNINVFMIISIVELIILIIVLILDYLRKNPISNLKKVKEDEKEVNIVTVDNNY